MFTFGGSNGRETTERSQCRYLRRQVRRAFEATAGEKEADRRGTRGTKRNTSGNNLRLGKSTSSTFNRPASEPCRSPQNQNPDVATGSLNKFSSKNLGKCPKYSLTFGQLPNTIPFVMLRTPERPESEFYPGRPAFRLSITP